jgi:hypothetical protein
MALAKINIGTKLPLIAKFFMFFIAQFNKKGDHDVECAPRSGQNGRFELTPLAGLPEDGSHDEASIAQRGIQASGC